MDYIKLIDDLPLWLVFIATVAIVGLSVETGYRLGRYRGSSEPSQHTLLEKDAPVGTIVAATLGLLAFMLAFTFSLAAGRFDARRMIVLEESNAIGTAWLRAGLLPEPIDVEAQSILKQYVDARLKGATTGELASAIAESAELQQALWSKTKAAAERDPHSIVTGLFIQSVNDVIDRHSKRILLAVHNRVPLVVWFVLYFIAAVTMAALGYQEGLAKSRRSWAVGALALTFSAVILLIGDLDRPQEGLLRVSQQSMLDLQRSMQSAGMGRSLE